MDWPFGYRAKYDQFCKLVMEREWLEARRLGETMIAGRPLSKHSTDYATVKLILQDAETCDVSVIGVSEMCRDLGIDTGEMLSLGGRLSHLGLDKLASVAFRAYVARYSDDAVGWVNLGHVLQVSAPLEAVDCYEKAIKLGANELTLVEDLAGCAMAVEDWPKAIAFYERHLSTEADDFSRMVSLSIAYSNSGDYDSAERWLRRALVDPRNRVSAAYNLHILATRNQNLDLHREALGYLQKWDPDAVQCKLAQLWECEQNGDENGAWEICRNLVESTWDKDDGEVDHIGTCVANYCYKTQRQDIADLEAAVYGGHFFHEAIFRILRERSRAFVQEAHWFRLLLHGIATFEVPGMQQCGYFREVWVIARNEDEARAIGLEFEQRLDSVRDLSVSECEDLGKLDEEGWHMGVMNADRGVSLYPL